MLTTDKAMSKDFEFDKIGKRMPYTTPNGFFEHLEDDIWEKIKDDSKKQEDNHPAITTEKHCVKQLSRPRILVRTIIAVAASIVIAFVVQANLSKPNDVSISDVDRAFSQLTTDDQTYLLDVYQDDVFIDETTEQAFQE